jgi:hypothetical protein
MSDEQRTRGAAGGESTRPCGLYRTTVAIEGKVPADALVYFHNHGDPGPGVYLAERWAHNRAVFATRGALVPDAAWPTTLVALPKEGFYRVDEELWCCAKRCRRFAQGALVQLGYNARAEPILFVPTVGERGVALPRRGNKIDEANLAKLSPLHVEERFGPGAQGGRGDPDGSGYLH